MEEEITLLPFSTIEKITCFMRKSRIMWNDSKKTEEDPFSTTANK